MLRTCPFNTVEMNSDDDRRYHLWHLHMNTHKEALGDKASYLKLGLINPLPVKLIKDFAAKVKKLYVIEELDDIIETHCRKIGLDPIGKAEFTYLGEYSQSYLQGQDPGRKGRVCYIPRECSRPSSCNVRRMSSQRCVLRL